MNTDDDRVSSLYREAGAPEPPRPLDDAILAASRSAVEQPRAARKPFTGGWPAAASIAAIVVITVILVPVLKQEEQRPAPAPVGQATAPAKSAEEAAPAATALEAVRKQAAPVTAPASPRALVSPDRGFSADQAFPPAVERESDMYILPYATEPLQAGGEESGVQPEMTDGRRSRMQAADSAPFAINTPEMWEARISQLISQGELEQAKAELEKLQQRYPDYSTNTSILELLD